MNYSEEFKESLVKKYYSGSNKNKTDFCDKNGVSKSVFYIWLKKFTLSNIGNAVEKEAKISNANLKIICEYYSQPKDKVGLWLRANGLYLADIEKLQQEIMNKTCNCKAEKKEVKDLKIENCKLKAELARKDKALAETTAILVLKKKLELLLGNEE